MARNGRIIPPTKLIGNWKKQDVNDIGDLERHKVRMPNDFTDWNKLSGDVEKWTMTKEELEAYNAKTKK
ncbi:hypothetical protein [Microcystis phage MaeS]|nr:hypothetical protein [Microcystis phage MaeS]